MVWAVRIVALAVTVALLRWTSQNLTTFYRSPSFNYDFGFYWRIQAAFVVAGLAFAIATRFPFPRSRYAWSRLVIAGIVMLPAVHFWYLLDGQGDPGTGFLSRIYWFDSMPFYVWALLAGVAVGAGFGARRSAGPSGSESDPEPEAL
jgi:hypothetical protein